MTPKENLEIEVSPFKSIPNPLGQKNDINILHSQINYTNQILYTIWQQLQRIENSIPTFEDIKNVKSNPTRHIY